MQRFAKDNHAIFWGDALEVLAKEIPDKSVDLLFADPPYNIGKSFNGTKEKWLSEEDYLEWSYQWLALCLSNYPACWQKSKPSSEIMRRGFH